MKNNNIFTIILLYTFTHVLLLFNFGILWDDRDLLGQSFELLSSVFTESGSNGGHPVATYIHWIILNNFNNPILVYHILTFFIFGLLNILVFKCLQYFRFTEAQANIITIIFAIVPYNFARTYAIILPYSIGILFMFLGLLFFCKYRNSDSFIYRGLSIFFAFAAYYLLNSTLLILPFLMFLHILINSKNNIKLKEVISNADNLVIVPLIYYLIKLTVFKPYGVYVGYNVITIEKLIAAPSILLSSIKASILYMPLYCYKLISSSIEAVVLLIFFTFLTRKIIKNKSEIITNIDCFSKKQSVILFSIGLALWIIASLPYNLVGHGVNFNAPESRDQILLPIGFSIIFFAGISFISRFWQEYANNHHFIYVLLVIMISILSTTTIIQYTDSIKAFYIEESFTKDIAKFKELENGRNVCIYSDNFNNKTWKEGMRFYVLTGISKLVFHHQRNLIIPIEDASNIKQSNFTAVLTEQNNCKDVLFNDTINYEIQNFDSKKIENDIFFIDLICSNIFNQEKYERLIEEISMISMRKVNKAI